MTRDEWKRYCMPIYVYEPTVYSHDEQVNECCSFEALQSMSEKPVCFCPTCGHAVHRAVTSFQITQGAFASDKGAIGERGEGGASNSAKNAARLAARHLCGAGCRH